MTQSTSPADISPPGEASPGLKTGAIRLPGVLMQSVTSIAPAIAGMFTVAAAIRHAGMVLSQPVISTTPSSG